MARIRAASTTAYAVALVIFVILFVFSLVAAILFYTKISQSEVRAQEANDKLMAVATPAQLTSLRTEVGAKTEGGTLLMGLQNELRKLRRMAAGSDSESADTLEKSMAVAGLKDTNLIAEVRRLQAELKSAETRISNAEASAKSAQDAQQKAIEEKAGAEARFNESVTELKSRLDEVIAKNAGFGETVKGQTTVLEDQLKAVRTASQGEIGVLGSQIDQKNKEIESLNKRIRDLQQRTQTRSAIDSSLEPKGRIVSILSDRGLVYINRGRAHRIQPGMTFLVGDRITGLSKDEEGELQGKAVVEVINVLESSSVARIVKSTRGNSVIEGDAIFNTAYDPNVNFKFVVFGEFDIDNTGTASVSDRRRIETLITQAGGSVVPELSYDTDFLVLSSEPKTPDALRADEIDQTRITEHAEQTRRYKQWQDLLSQAKALSIPVLNQNRFLTLVGYYQR